MHHRSILLVVGVCVLSALTTLPAQAAFPGKNGKIAFETMRQDTAFAVEIYTMNADGSGLTNVTNNGDPVDRSPAWSPDGTKIAFHTLRDGDAEIYTMNADGTGQTNITNNAARDILPAWSPDGTKIAFQTNRDGANEIYTMNADGSGLTNVTNHTTGDLDPDWSPDGTKIAFDRIWTGGYREVWTMNADGTGQTNITNNPAHDYSPAWSPDGTKIAFGTLRDGDTEVYTMNADGSDQTNVTNNGAGNLAGDWSPAWSPDGTKIAFETTRDGDLDVYTMNADGSNPTNVTNTAEGSNGSPDWQPIPINSYPRPKAATTVEVPLVPAYAPCTVPNRLHGPPLAHDSCNPPTQASDEATLGTADSNSRPTKGMGLVRYKAVAGDPATPADEADVKLAFALGDVYDQSTLADYTGELRLRTGVRITDKLNTPHPGGPGAATVSNTTLSATVPCATSSDPNEGASCNLISTLDALVPGSAPERKRSVWELGQVQVDDGGADGDADTPTDNTLFMTQGLFIP